MRRETSPRATRSRTLAAVALVATAALLDAAVAWPATSHTFTATYHGTGSGRVSGTTVAGSATATGRGKLIGPGSLSGFASGVFTSPTCVVFSGTAVLKGRPGSIMLAVHRARACAAGTDASNVSFSGSAKVAGGTSTFAGARGTLSFTGTYARANGAVTISFRGRITF